MQKYPFLLGLAPAPARSEVGRVCPCFGPCSLVGAWCSPLCCNKPSVPLPLLGKCPRGRLALGRTEGPPLHSPIQVAVPHMALGAL